ncbi:MAG: hypothetical protein R3264_18865, partial [Anaerolineae bacterium]|nr:hypothetical protein [Anaerolineae bacterium]
MKKINPLLLVVAIIVPLFCVAVLLVGVLGFGLIYAASNGDSIAASALISPEAAEAEVLAIAANYQATGDLESARQQLHALDVPNPEQYVSFMIDRYLQEGRGLTDPDTMNLFALADALGATTPSMIAALSTPTPAPTPTLPPTFTPTPAPAVEDTPTPLPSPTEALVEEPTEAPTPTEELPEPTATSVPTDTPIPEPPTPAPPTDTPEPPPPATDFVLREAYLIPNPAYNSCPGSHQIFVTVVDAAGNPLDGVTVEDTFRAVPPKISGEKGPGKLEYDLWNNGFSLEITKKADGSPATSDVTPKLSSWDEDIPNEWLVEANYCTDLNDCLQRKSNN